MLRSYLLTLMALAVSTANAANVLIDNFESYGDDAALQEAWVFSKASGPDGLSGWLETENPAEGGKSLMMDVNMPEKWWHNRLRKEIPGGPVNLAEFLTIEFQFAGDPNVDPANLLFNVFLYDSQGRILFYQVPGANVTNPEWQKITLSLDSFGEMEWDEGYGKPEPDADKTDIVAVGLMVVGNDDNQSGILYVDDIQLREKPLNLKVEDFEGYADDAELQAAWTYSKAGGPDGIVYGINNSNTPPQGSNALLMDVNMPNKWWFNTLRKELGLGSLNLANYAALELWFYGDASVVPGQTSFTVFLYDSKNRVMKYPFPNSNVTTAAWQKMTLSLDNFIQEEWDEGYGQPEPDADPKDIVALGLMTAGDEDNQIAKFYVDDIQFVSKTDSSKVGGTILENGQPLAGVTVYAVEQNSILQTTTDGQGAYAFDELAKGKQYRLLPVKVGYDFTPGAVLLTLLDVQYTQDFTGAPSVYNRLETAAITDSFDASGLNPAVVYRGAREWGHDEAGDVRPVIDVTQDKTFTVNFPDAEGTDAFMPGIPANTLSGASSPKYALEVGSYYGWDMLAFGQNADRNYYAEVDVYCDVRDYLTENTFDRASLAVHCSFADPDKPSMDAYADSNANRTSGGYALTYESDLGIISARKYAPNNDKAHARGRLEGYATEYGKATLTESGWHRLRIEFLNDKVTYFVDGTQVAQTTDTEYPFGPAGLHYRACFSDAPTDLANMNHARFDNLKAGPTGSPTRVENWMLN